MRALVVEDDPVSAKLIEAALKSEGIISEPAETGEDAIDLAKHYELRHHRARYPSPRHGGIRGGAPPARGQDPHAGPDPVWR